MSFTSGWVRGSFVLLTLACAPGCASDTTATDAAGGDAFTTPDTGIDSATDSGVRVPTYHRADDSACTGAAPAGNCSFGGGGGPDCSMDSDCTGGTNGRCNMNIGGAAFCRCTYDTCAHDTDCATGETCACHGAAYHADSNECIAGNCRTDADCGTQGFCSPTIGGCGGLAGYFCHTPSDTCLDDTDCTSGSLQACQYVAASSRWACVDRQFCP